jgi:hypothetical protein
MAESPISKRLLDIISNQSAGNAEGPGKPPFPDFRSHFHGHEGVTWPGKHRRPLVGVSRALNQARGHGYFAAKTPNAPNYEAACNEAAATSLRKPRVQFTSQ